MKQINVAEVVPEIYLWGSLIVDFGKLVKLCIFISQNIFIMIFQNNWRL